MKNFGRITIFTFGFLLIFSNEGMSGEIVERELGIRLPDKVKNFNTGCGNVDRRMWFGYPFYLFVLDKVEASIACQFSNPSLKDHIPYLTSPEMKYSQFGDVINYSSSYLDFEYQTHTQKWKLNPERKCYGFRSDILLGGSAQQYVVGIYCSSSDLNESEFKKQISKIRFDFQTKRSSQPVPATPPKTTSNPQTPFKANDSNSSVEDRLAAIKRLLDKGLISEDEAKAKRQEIIKNM